MEPVKTVVESVLHGTVWFKSSGGFLANFVEIDEEIFIELPQTPASMEKLLAKPDMVVSNMISQLPPGIHDLLDLGITIHMFTPDWKHFKRTVYDRVLTTNELPLYMQHICMGILDNTNTIH
jgi:hypothetical protein